MSKDPEAGAVFSGEVIHLQANYGLQTGQRTYRFDLFIDHALNPVCRYSTFNCEEAVFQTLMKLTHQGTRKVRVAFVQRYSTLGGEIPIDQLMTPPS